MNQIYIISKEKFTPELKYFLSDNPITELESIEFFIFFDDYSGIIFYIPEEQLYGCEIIWEKSSRMFITFGVYCQYMNQITHNLEKEYFNHLHYLEEVFNG